MKKPLIAALVLLTTLTACSTVRGSRLNPFNWFGGSEPAPAQVVEQVVPVVEDHRLLAQQITELHIDRMPGGAIVRATAVMASQGWWEAELVARDEDPADGDLVLEFRVLPPVATTATGTPRSRQVTAATYLPDLRLERITRLSVVGETNGLTSRR